MESVGGVVGGWHQSVGSVADGWHQWVLGEMEWLVREGLVGGDFLNFFVLGISRNGVYRLRQKKKKIWLINRVLETRFSSGRHMENKPNQM